MRRLWGPDRIETAVEVSRASFGDGEAGTVVLARADDYADVLAGTPVAAGADAPLLITPSDDLAGVVADELRRVLPAGATVHLLGGEVALDASVAQQVIDLGYEVVRLAGPTRVETAIAIAGFLGDPDELLITTGFDYPDALAAGTAASQAGGAVLLTTSEAAHPAVDAYLAGRDGARVHAVGGPAVRAYPAVAPVMGSTRDGTAVAVAETFFTAPEVVGFAGRGAFPDALAGGAHIARLGGPLLLTSSDTLSTEAAQWTCANGDSLQTAYTYGGTAALTDDVMDAIHRALDGTGCD